jgi:hypothetical protein
MEGIEIAQMFFRVYCNQSLIFLVKLNAKKENFFQLILRKETISARNALRILFQAAVALP